jgi:hypothetical protein
MTPAGFSQLSLLGLAAAVALLGAAGALAPGPAAAQGTPQQQQACSGDAQRLCGEFIPDIPKIQACMSRKRSQLSAACRAAITTPSSHGHKYTHYHHSS